MSQWGATIISYEGHREAMRQRAELAHAVAEAAIAAQRQSAEIRPIALEAAAAKELSKEGEKKIN